MFAARSLVRSAPRVAARLSTTCLVKSARTTPSIRSTVKLSMPRAAFSMSHRCQATAGEVDAGLIEKIESEMQMEKEMRDEDEIPQSVKDYLSNGPFEIKDTPGSEEVVLTRKFGNETITVKFSVRDLNNMDPEADFGDRALGDEEDINGEESNAEAKEDGADAEEGEQSFPARIVAIIEKPGKGAMCVETVAQDGLITIDNVHYYASAKAAHSKTAEVEHAARDDYVGPPFGNLDEDLQILMEKYLDERGINTALALFVPDYIDMKEQKEYLRWLESVKDFVKA